jgi:hypothetical protein
MPGRWGRSQPSHVIRHRMPVLPIYLLPGGTLYDGQPATSVIALEPVTTAVATEHTTTAQEMNRR